MLLEERDRFWNCLWAQVFEGWWDHCLTLVGGEIQPRIEARTLE